MTKGTNVKCSGCLQRYNLYTDMAQQKNGYIYGRCPKCGRDEGYSMADSEWFGYNNGNVAPHLKGEGAYDWSWTRYTPKSEPSPLQQTADAFDTSISNVESNLGWSAA